MRWLAFVALVLIALTADAHGQAYPTRPVEFVIPFAPGGPTDTAIRLIQPALSANLGAPVVLVNKAGGGGAIGMDAVAKAKPDGYLLAATVRSTLTILPATQPDVPYKISDFAPIGTYAVDSQVLLVKSGAPWKTLEELIEHARKNPGKLTYGSAGQGTNSFFTMELVKLAHGLDVAHVPFGGSGPVKNAILGGHVNVACSGLGSLAPVIRSGDLVALVTTAPKRVAGFTQVPTMAEKGHGEASLNIWMGLFVPAKTPKPVVDQLTRAFNQAAKDPAVLGALDKAGMQGFYYTGEETTRLLAEEAATVARVAERAGLRK